MSTTSIPAPRTGYSRHKSTRSKFEMFAWLFMRVSGVVLVILIFGHLFVNLWAGDGVQAIDFGFVAGKWASPFWQIWDLLMLWLAMLHGTNGLREARHTHGSAGDPLHRLDHRHRARHPRHLHVRSLPGRSGPLGPG